MDDLELKECFRAKLKKDSVQKVFKSLSQKDMKALALIALKDLKRQVERLEELRVEREAFTQTPPKPDRYDNSIDPSGKNDFRDLFDNPQHFYGKKRTKYIGNYNSRQSFRRWLKGLKLDFDTWYKRAESSCAPDKKAFFEQDWHPGGVFACVRERAVASIGGQITAMVEKIVMETSLNLTKELLDTEFCVGDGRRVSWGDASKDDHEQRIAMLRTNSVANIEAEARHKKAIELLMESGVSCLKELPVESDN